MYREYPDGVLRTAVPAVRSTRCYYPVLYRHVYVPVHICQGRAESSKVGSSNCWVLFPAACPRKPEKKGKAPRTCAYVPRPAG